jgi:hypothetical protein
MSIIGLLSGAYSAVSSYLSTAQEPEDPYLTVRKKHVEDTCQMLLTLSQPLRQERKKSHRPGGTSPASPSPAQVRSEVTKSSFSYAPLANSSWIRLLRLEARPKGDGFEFRAAALSQGAGRETVHRRE